jgi:hypothetical protein
METILILQFEIAAFIYHVVAAYPAIVPLLGAAVLATLWLERRVT